MEKGEEETLLELPTSLFSFLLWKPTAKPKRKTGKGGGASRKCKKGRGRRQICLRSSFLPPRFSEWWMAVVKWGGKGRRGDCRGKKPFLSRPTDMHFSLLPSLGSGGGSESKNCGVFGACLRSRWLP